MANTRHGHHIPGTVNVPPTSGIARCMGVNVCASCKKDVNDYWSTRENSAASILPESPSDKARKIVLHHVNEDRARSGLVEISLDHIFLVWFSKTLGNWKALVISGLPDQLYYEVTYNGSKLETYLDIYTKEQNIAITDEAYRHILKGE